MYKSILVHVDNSQQCLHRVEVAALLAIQYEAHLVGSATTGLSAFAFPVGGLEPGTPTVVFPVEELRAAANRDLDKFDAAASGAGVNLFERRLLDDEAGLGIALQARYCDLIVISQYSRDSFAPRIRSDFPEYVVLNSVRPVLILPYNSAGMLNLDVITVAWNGGGEAVRAITAALPILKRAKRVHVAVFDAESSVVEHGEEPGADIALYLSRHGVKVDVTATQSAGEPGESLISFAVEKGSDLIVMGAYGHSRFHEFFLGGVSQTMLASSPLALLMTH